MGVFIFVLKDSNLLLRNVIIVTILLLSLSLEITAKETSQDYALDEIADHGGLPIPKNLEDLRNFSVNLWFKFHTTLEKNYVFINNVAKYRAYLNVCKRYNISLKIDPLTKASKLRAKTLIFAHFQNEDLDIFNSMDDAEQAAFLDEIAGDVISFEYGRRVVLFQNIVKESDSTRLAYCKNNEKNYRDDYVALGIIARRILKAK